MSFKKAQKACRTPHRERGQLLERKELGTLEKKKDYKKRAKNYHNKQAQLKALRKKALARNPDEFYFKMVHKKLEDGLHWMDNPESEVTTTEAQQQLLETQDLNYINWKLQVEKKKVEKLKEKVKLLQPVKAKNRHVFFMDTKNDIKQKTEESDSMSNAAVENDPNPHLVVLQKELRKRCHRVKELQSVAEKMMLQRTISKDGKHAKELVQEEEKNSAAIYRWKPLRKR